MIKEYCTKFFFYFDKNKKTFYKYSILSFIVGMLELLGVALTYPFVLKILTNKQTDFWHSPFIIGFCIVILFIFKNAVMIFYSYLQAKFTKDVEKEVNLKFINYFLGSTFQNSSKISLADKRNILGFLIPHTINNFILRLQNLSVNFFIFALISALLVIKFPIAMAITLFFAFLLIFIQNKCFKPLINEISKKSNEASRNYNERGNEILLNIKGIKASHNELFFFDNYKNAITDFYKICAKTSFVNTIPPYVTEPFIILLLFILLAIISLQNYSEPNKLIASFAIIVSAIFRLAPTISRIQTNLNGINAVSANVKQLLDWCDSLKLNTIEKIKTTAYANFNNKIELKNINFCYRENQPVLKNINLDIKKGEFIGIAGLSGSGKTTLIDIISGLLTPTNGEILVDEKKQNLPLKIGYIPQEISLINATIRENVAFGSSEVDDSKIIDALKKAQLYEFINQNYTDGIYANPFVDTTGFSQGQKQRLAIARALYSNPDILILDEATSSLDLKTEDELCTVLLNLRGEKTILAIAHRLSTIKSADKIIFMKNSEIADISEFNDLINKNNDFKELVRLASFKEP